MRRRQHGEPMVPHPVILFDGACTLCSRWVMFVIARDPRARFRFGSLQSEAARALLAAHGLAAGADAGADPDTIVLVEDGRHYERSAAVVRILRSLRTPWPVVAIVATVVPRPLRDAIYAAVARRRYRWFGRREACLVPPPDVRDRFIDV